MFEMQSVLEGPASSKARLAALATVFHLTVATALLVGLAWRIDAVEAPNLMEAFLPVAFPPAQWSAAPTAPARPHAAAPADRPPTAVQPKEVTAALTASATALAEMAIAALEPATTSSGLGDAEALPGSGELAPAGGIGLPEGGAVVFRPDMVAPRVLFRIDPVFPDAARIAHRQGTVVVEAEIGTDGRLRSTRVVSSPLGFGLEQSALDAIRNWRFAPASYGERPVAVYYRWNIQFSLR